MATNKSTPTPVVPLVAIATADLGEKLSAHRVSLAHLRQIIVSYQANLRRATADTKKRGEVSGGGRKPWRQKGTGRARVGSSRTPLWRGGGIVFGPTTERNYTQSISKTSKLRALADAIILKVKSGNAHQLDLAEAITKTREASRILASLGYSRKTLVVVPEFSIGKAFANVSNVRLIIPSQLTAGNVSSFHTVVFVNGAWETVKNKFN